MPAVEPSVYLSWYEIHGDSMSDLLASPAAKTPLKFKDDPQRGQYFVKCSVDR